MAGSVNKAIILGNLGQDPEVRTTQSGQKIVTLSIATSETWRDKSTGEKRERTEWHRVVIFNEGLAGIAEKYLRKGSKVFVEGMISTRKWEDQSGQTRYSTEIVLKAYQGALALLDGGGGGRGRAESEADYGSEPGSPPPGDAAPADSFDDEIPF